MTSAYLGKMLVHFFELAFLKCNGNNVFLFKNTYNNDLVTFCLKVIFCGIFGGCLYILFAGWSYSKQLRNYDLAN